MIAAKEKVLATARAQIGYLEKKSNSDLGNFYGNVGNGNFNKFAAFLDNLGYYNGKKQGFDYCDVFHDYLYIYTFGVDLGTKMLYQPLKSCGAGVKYSAGYYKANNAFFFKDPEPCDQVFFWSTDFSTYGHTGMVESYDGKIIHTIEGNTTVSKGQQGVARKTYSKTYKYLAGFGRPNWALAEKEEAEMAMTQADFNKMFAVAMAAYKAEQQDKGFRYSDAEAEAARNYCIAKGLIKGSGADAKGQPKYMWQDDITREQLSLILYRQAKIEGKV